MLVCVLLDDAEGVVMRIERSHKNKRDIDAERSVEMFDLPDSEIEEGHVVLDFQSTLCAGHT